MMLHKMRADLETTLKGGRIQKIYQLSTFELLFNVKAKKKHQLLLNATRQHPRISLTFEDYDKPMQPPMFCMFLRKHLEGGIIDHFTQYGNDRVIDLDILSVDERKARTNKHLIFEILGKDTNLIVTDAEYKILDALNHQSPFEGQRTVAPGATYQAPKDERINPFDEEALKSALDEGDFNSSKSLLKTFQGISPLFASEALYRSEHENLSLFEAFKTLKEAYAPEVRFADKTVYAYYAITHKEGETVSFDSLSAMLDYASEAKDRRLKESQHSRHLTKFINRELDKKQGKLERLIQDLRESEHTEEDKVRGDLILTYQHAINPGDKTLTCENYLTNKEETIPLDPKKTPIENANHYFSRYKKKKRAVPHLEKGIRKLKRAITYFQELRSQLDYADLADLHEIKQELIERGYMKPSSRQKDQKLSKKAKHLTFKDPDGITILVGKNNRQNAHLTHDVAHHTDTWFHVKDAPGSHVIARAPFDSLSETTIRTAANLAALYSKMRHSSSVPVDYTEVRHVKKIPGRPSNEVRYTNQKTIYIDPDEALLKTLTAKQ
ncbi:MAG: Rqc2 family fibronectin-binding protein [Bacillota bacterium]